MVTNNRWADDADNHTNERNAHQLVADSDGIVDVATLSRDAVSYILLYSLHSNFLEVKLPAYKAGLARHETGQPLETDPSAQLTYQVK